MDVKPSPHVTTSGVFLSPTQPRLLCVFPVPALGLATSVCLIRHLLREGSKKERLVKNKINTSL